MKDTTIGLDLAKNTFYLIVLDPKGNILRRKKLSRGQVLRYFVQQSPCTVAMEACRSANYWGRQLREMGHHVVLLPAQHVKAYLRGQKNDYNDARAIAEAALHGSIRPARIKSVEQQDEQAFHRLRQQNSGELTRMANQMRGLLEEYGIAVAQGISALRRAIPEILEDAENGLTERFRHLLNRQYHRFLALEEELSWFDKQLKKEAKEDDVSRRLCELPGFGPVVSSVFKSWLGDGKQFKRGRDASAALGIVPRQHSTGGKDRLLGISKRGDSYVRCQVIHGARAVVMRAPKKTDSLSLWINSVVARRGFNKAVVALANKLVRMAWVIVARQERYQPSYVGQLA